MRRVSYLNIITFPISLQFKNHVLGIRRKVDIGGLNGTLYLPNPNITQIDTPFHGLLPPKVKGIELAIRVYERAESKNHEDIHWGSYFTFNKHDPNNTALATVRHAVLTIPAEQGGMTLSVDDVANKCFRDLPGWSNRLIAWIEVLTGDDLDSVHPLSASIVTNYWTSAAWIHGTKKDDFDFVNPALTLLGSSGEHALDVQTWSRVIRAANANRDIPDAWALLRDAHRARRRRLYRRAVLDAATAVELVIDTALRAQLSKGNPQSFIDQLMKNTWQVSKRIDLMAALNMYLPQDIQNRLFKRRNKVIHNNVAAAAPDAKNAIDAGDELVRYYAMKALQ